MVHQRTSGFRLVAGFAALLSVVVAGWLPATALAADPATEPIVDSKPHVAVCAASVAPGFARCHAQRRTDAVAVPQGIRPEDARPNGMSPLVIGDNGAYTPTFLQSAYNLTSISASAGLGQTVGIVDAFDAPNAETDLGTYRAKYGLSACTTANGCFRKVNQSGAQGPYPVFNSGWAQEISLDVDMVSAICPNCHIVLVEANSNSLADLGASVNTAASLGATAISNSYGGSEYSSEASDEAAYYNHPGLPITVSSGDSGFGVEFPAASQYVTAVGGTTLLTSTNSRGWSETVWSGAGAGCSTIIGKPTWQTDTGCPRRTVADVSAIANPNTGVWVYDGGWLIFGGTSVASPIIASVYALAQDTSVTYAKYPYQTPTSLNDVTAGRDGSCSIAYLCTGEKGYDGPSGLGTPNGTRSFQPPAATPAPTVSAISPNTGPTTGGTSVTISGTNFVTGASATLGGKAATNVVVTTNTSISATTPAGTAGAVDVVVTNPDGQSATLASVYTYTSSTAATFAVAANPTSPTVVAGRSTQSVVTLTTSNGYASSVNLSVSSLPTGVAASFSPTTVTPTSTGASSTLTIQTAPTTASGTYALTVTAKGTDAAATTSSTTLSLTVENFSIAASPASLTVVRGSNATDSITLTSSGGFNSTVNLLVAALPAGVTASFNPTSVTPTPSGAISTLTLSVSSSAAPGTYTVTIGGASSGNVRKATLALTIE